MKVLGKIEEGIISILLIVATAVLFGNIVLRYGFNANTNWAHELIRYLMIWITFIGAAVCFRKGAHVGIDFILGLLGSKATKALKVFVQLMGIVFMVILLMYSTELVLFTKGTGQITPSLEIPLYFVYLVIPIGAALSIIHLIVLTIQVIMNKEKVKTENATE
ncbi:TRAP transporter small permease [Bacillus piscicola]|uniref:TRAP transporter small permease n=1 Tax=Bacillus piscicola TaxID=1632684 RepID=UPI001F0959BC|nr:TRAP transporter small permease [Bacillus piscicola]